MESRGIIEKILSHPLAYKFHSSMVDREKFAAIQKIRKDFGGLKVLDIGCGPGNNVRLFTGADYTGIDINEDYIARARKNQPSLRFLVGDAEEIEWERTFDVISFNSFFHHIDDRKALRILEKAKSSLKEEGLIIIQDALLPRKGEWYHRLMSKLDRGDYFRNLEQWKMLVKEAGFFLRQSDFYELKVFGIKGYHIILMALGKEALTN